MPERDSDAARPARQVRHSPESRPAQVSQVLLHGRHSPKLPTLPSAQLGTHCPPSMRRLPPHAVQSPGPPSLQRRPPSVTAPANRISDRRPRYSNVLKRLAFSGALAKAIHVDSRCPQLKLALLARRRRHADGVCCPRRLHSHVLGRKLARCDGLADTRGATTAAVKVHWGSDLVLAVRTCGQSAACTVRR